MLKHVILLILRIGEKVLYLGNVQFINFYITISKKLRLASNLMSKGVEKKYMFNIVTIYYPNA